MSDDATSNSLGFWGNSLFRFVLGKAHYPGSVESLYSWTPDEATIEFYAPTQPCIFRSKHRGMTDLALPLWCKGSPDAFIEYHRRLLESEYVSRRLQLWINLSFGEALGGKRAVAEKNVVVSAVPWANGGGQSQCQGDCHSSVFAGCFDADNHRIDSGSKKAHFVQLFTDPHPRKHSDMRKTVSSALRGAFHQNKREAAECVDYDGGVNNGFQSRKQRDISTIGAILKECYISARVVPPPAVDEAITNLLAGALDIRQSLRGLVSNSAKTFPFPCQIANAYEILSKVQSLSFQRMRNDSLVGDDAQTIVESTDLEHVWRLVQNLQSLEPLSRTSAGLILPTILHPLKSPESFIENSISGFHPALTDRFHDYLVLICTRHLPGMPNDFIG